MKLVTLSLLLLLSIPTPVVGGEQQAPPKEEKERIPTLRGDPADHYYKGWLLVQDAKKREELAEVKELYRSALRLFNGIRKIWPDWKKDMIVRRIRNTEELLKQADSGR